MEIYFQVGKWTNEIAKPQISINSNSSSSDCNICNRKYKVTSTRVVKITRVPAAALVDSDVFWIQVGFSPVLFTRGLAAIGGGGGFDAASTT